MIKSIIEFIHEYYNQIIVILGFLITIICLKEFKYRLLLLAFIGIILIILGVVNKVEENKEKAQKQLSGVLQPESEISKLAEGVLPKLRFKIGQKNGGAITDCLELSEVTKGNPNLKPLENLSCVYSKDGSLIISAKIIAKDGSVIAKLDNNEWLVNPTKSLQRNFTKDTLEVIDESDDVVLQVRLLKDEVQILGIFYGEDGKGVAIWSEGASSVFRFLNPEEPKPKGLIKPIFKYPSDRHLGELK